LNGDITHCQLYGVRGQDQQGIDLYALPRGQSSYRVYQCKREEDFTAGKIKKAVTAFLAGQWVPRTAVFVLCTKEPLTERKRADEIEAQRAVLAGRGIEFESWDSVQLSARLKDHPRLVDDFFGRHWAEAFCGADAVTAFGTRLDAAAVSEFRTRLGAFYTRVFETHDPGLAIGPSGTPGPGLRVRYVIPDVLEYRSDDRASGNHDGAEKRLNEPEKADQPPGGQAEPTRERRPALAWVTATANTVLLAPPGGGKSSFLRFIALDLLDPTPRQPALVERWGTHLPVWLSFSWWTRQIAERGADCSLTDVLRQWLHSWDEDRLWPLVERALDDDRLLLLVDGLDEWADENAARIALARLQVFVTGRQVPSVAVSRPHGFHRIGVRPRDWQIAELAGLSLDQQRELARHWFLHLESTRQALEALDQVARRAATETDALMAEVGAVTDIATLAENPLLLTLLIYHRMHNVRLPQSRFRAYESLVNHLIEVHPRRRESAANAPAAGGGLTGEEVRQTLSSLAIHILSEDGAGAIEIEDAVRHVAAFLSDPEAGLGLEPSRGRREARVVVEVGENALGLVVRHAPTRIGFLHRTFLEYLAAVHLSRLPAEEVLATVERRAIDPLWREVVLGVFHGTRRPREVEALVACIRRLKDEALPNERLTLETLLAEIAFGEVACPPRLAQELAQDAFSVVETGSRMTHREALLGHVLRGLTSTRVGDLVRDRIRGWFPCWFRWRASVFEEMGRWPADPAVTACLWRGLHDEEPQVRKAAGLSLARVGAGDDDLGGRVVTLARTAGEPLTRAAALAAWGEGWPHLGALNAVADEARGSASPEVRLEGIRRRIGRGRHGSEDREDLFLLAARGTDVERHWRRDIPGLLIRGWPGDLSVRDRCLDILRRPEPIPYRGDEETAWRTLLVGFPQDSAVAVLIGERLDGVHAFWHLVHDVEGWELVARNFCRNERLAPILDEWLARSDDDGWALAWGSAAAGTPAAKARLLASLSDPKALLWWTGLGLVEGWGNDPEVSEAFRRLLVIDPRRAGQMAHLYPRLIPDRAECRAQLLSLLRDREFDRHEFAMRGLVELGGPTPDTEVVDAVLELRERGVGIPLFFREGCYFPLIRHHHADARVRRLALSEFADPEPGYSAIAAAAANDAELRGQLLERLTPLPAPLRMSIAERLPRESPDRFLVLERLGLYRREENAEVKCQAALSYWTTVKAAGLPTDAQLGELARDIVCYGLDHEEQRQAAFCGLTTLNRLDLMAGVQERHGDDRLCAIHLWTDYARTNVPLARCILANWDAITAAFGDETCRRLNHRKDGWLALWNYLAPHADGFPLARESVLRFLESRPPGSVASGVLRFLGRIVPRSRPLLDYCLAALHIGDDETDPIGHEALVAAELLGTNFRGDQDILDRLFTGRAGTNIYEKTILCLCEGWATDERLDRMYRVVTERQLELHTVTMHHLICRRGPAERVVEEITSLVNNPGRPAVAGSPFVRPFSRRVGEDSGLAGMLLDHLRGTPTPSDKATLPQLLASAPGASAELLAWCRDEMARQERRCELGYDWISGRVRSVVQCLLDVMQPGVAVNSTRGMFED
jgi:hypothetical protein